MRFFTLTPLEKSLVTSYVIIHLGLLWRMAGEILLLTKLTQAQDQFFTKPDDHKLPPILQTSVINVILRPAT